METIFLPLFDEQILLSSLCTLGIRQKVCVLYRIDTINYKLGK